MGDKQDKQTQEALRDLLKKNNSSGKGTDDFEREALEGFALLENEEEILNTKDQLDERIYPEVFTQKKNTHTTFYWIAAAALILVVGFSVYLVQQHPLNQSHDLAVSQSPAKTQETPGANDEKIEGLSPLEKDRDPSDIQKTEENSFKKPKKSPEPAEVAAEKEVAAAEQKFTGVSSSGNETAADDALAVQEDLENHPAEGTVRTAEQVAAPVNAKVAVHNAPIAKSPAAMSGAAAPPMSTEVAVVSAKTSRSKKQESRTEEQSEITCNYKGGDKALQKLVKQGLNEKNLVTKFDATLFVNSAGKVEKVILTKPFALSASEQQQVTELLKTLSDFVFLTPPENGVLSEYNLQFRP